MTVKPYYSTEMTPGGQSVLCLTQEMDFLRRYLVNAMACRFGARIAPSLSEMNSGIVSDSFSPALYVLGLCGFIALVLYVIRRRMPIAEIQYGCRASYGPLELRIQATESANGFRVFVEDHRQDPFCVSEEVVQSTLESAKERLTLKAGEYLAGKQDAARYEANWRCS